MDRTFVTDDTEHARGERAAQLDRDLTCVATRERLRHVARVEPDARRWPFDGRFEPSDIAATLTGHGADDERLVLTGEQLELNDVADVTGEEGGNPEASSSSARGTITRVR